MSELAATATHEAAHAVTSVLAGLGVPTRVRIYGDGGGLTELRRPPADADWNRVLRAKMLVCAIGPAAEAAIGPVRSEWWSL